MPQFTNVLLFEDCNSVVKGGIRSRGEASREGGGHHSVDQQHRLKWVQTSSQIATATVHGSLYRVKLIINKQGAIQYSISMCRQAR